MNKNTGEPADLRARLLEALAVNRAARLNFPGVFMRLSGTQEGEDALSLHYDDGPWSHTAAGEVHWPVLGVLLDVALGAVTRLRTGPGHRPATVQLEARFTGHPVRRDPEIHARFSGYTQGSAVKHATSEATLTAGGLPVAHATGGFVMLELPEGVTQRPLPWAPPGLATESLAARDLREDERAVLRHFQRAQKRADAQHAFIEHFWGGVPRHRARGARLSIAVAPHLGNRVGQVHGGLLFGLAAYTACAAVPAMRLSNITAWFCTPGKGGRLGVASTVQHQGRNIAVVRTQVTGPGGARVLEAASQHVRAA